MLCHILENLQPSFHEHDSLLEHIEALRGGEEGSLEKAAQPVFPVRFRMLLREEGGGGGGDGGSGVVVLRAYKIRFAR